MTTDRLPVLIAGAGPTGLVLALSLVRRGVRPRVISRAKGPGERSRAMVVQARTLELYRQFGFADAIYKAGIALRTAHLREGGDTGAGREVASFPFEGIGEELSPYPMPLAYPQDDHERFLLAELENSDVGVEWQTSLETFTQNDAGVAATLVRPDGSKEVAAFDYVCGCDGVHSAVRETLGIGFPGGTYPQLYYVVDCTTDGGFEKDLIFNLGKQAFVLLLPVRSRGVQRLIGIVPPDVPQREDLTFDDIRSRVEPLIGRAVTEVHWFSTYRVHHRVAESFHVKRAFILGDAGHVHSPAGAQGMNTGIGDAINLGWKLAMVVNGRAPASLLETYESERIGFARKLVDTTDRGFTIGVAGGLRGEIARRFLVPLVFSLGTSTAAGRRAMFRILSQIGIEYEESALSEGHVGKLAAGQRLPWIAAVDNFAPLSSLDWQVHVYGEVSAAVRDACAKLSVPLHRFPWAESAGKAGLARDAVYLVRPDGYIGYEGDASGVPKYWCEQGFR